MEASNRNSETQTLFALTVIAEELLLAANRLPFGDPQRDRLEIAHTEIAAVRAQVLLGMVSAQAEALKQSAKNLKKIATWISNNAIASVKETAKRIRQAAQIAGAFAELARAVAVV